MLDIKCMDKITKSFRNIGQMQFLKTLWLGNVANGLLWIWSFVHARLYATYTNLI